MKLGRLSSDLFCWIYGKERKRSISLLQYAHSF